MRVIKWDPFTSPRIFSRWPRIFDETEWPEIAVTDGLDVYETENEVIVEAAVPGVPADKVDISFEDGVLRITAQVEETEEEKKKKKVVYRQQKMSTFDYTTTLPRAVDGGKISAVVDDGVVTVTAPIAQEAKPKKIAVKTKAKK